MKHSTITIINSLPYTNVNWEGLYSMGRTQWHNSYVGWEHDHKPDSQPTNNFHHTFLPIGDSFLNFLQYCFVVRHAVLRVVHHIFVTFFWISTKSLSIKSHERTFIILELSYKNPILVREEAEGWGKTGSALYCVYFLPAQCFFHIRLKASLKYYKGTYCSFLTVIRVDIQSKAAS